MKIGLYGIGGVYNFGCEAIVRGAYQLLNKLYPNCRIIYFSYNYEYDSKMLADLEIEICEIRVNRTIAKRAINKALSIVGYDKRILMMDFKHIVDKVDIIYSIGGDIYTIPAVLRANAVYPYYNHLVDFCDNAIRKGKEVIAYGASIGPFGTYERAIQYYEKNLSRYQKIVCREHETMEYLQQLGLGNTMFLPDPAFLVKGKDLSSEKKYIGINLSPLSLNEIYGSYGEKSINKLSKLLDKVYETFETDLLFIPHVLSDDENDNDLLFLQKVYCSMSECARAHVKFANYSGGFLGVKEQIQECHFVVCARMHCAINAIVENIPAIFLSYSQKSIGMCKYIYGTKDWLIDIRNIENELIQKMQEMMINNEKVNVYLDNRNHEIQQYYDVHFSEIVQ